MYCYIKIFLYLCRLDEGNNGYWLLVNYEF